MFVVVFVVTMNLLFRQSHSACIVSVFVVVFVVGVTQQVQRVCL